MKLEVQQAIEEIRNAFPGVMLEVEPDPEGGAFVKAHDFHLGHQYEQERSWSAFRITFQYPFADIYPHFFLPNLRRKDGKSLGEAFHLNKQWQHPGSVEPATMVSRKSNRRNPATETAALKLAKVLDWIRSR
ncbi:MAG: hypothetical protein HZA88_04780 [Verrucomicrobia bacterium]|nr:hypothetical protein [Verrucomicrobiota bacterium]